MATSAVAFAQVVERIEGLESLFSEGSILQDRNGDGSVDFVKARIVVSEDASPAEHAATAEVAARLGFETSALDEAILDYLVSGNHRVERKTEDYQDGVRWMLRRLRPPESDPQKN